MFHHRCVCCKSTGEMHCRCVYLFRCGTEAVFFLLQFGCAFSQSSFEVMWSMRTSEGAFYTNACPFHSQRLHPTSHSSTSLHESFEHSNLHPPLITHILIHLKLSKNKVKKIFSHWLTQTQMFFFNSDNFHHWCICWVNASKITDRLSFLMCTPNNVDLQLHC